MWSLQTCLLLLQKPLTVTPIALDPLSARNQKNIPEHTPIKPRSTRVKTNYEDFCSRPPRASIHGLHNSDKYPQAPQPRSKQQSTDRGRRERQDLCTSQTWLGFLFVFWFYSVRPKSNILCLIWWTEDFFCGPKYQQTRWGVLPEPVDISSGRFPHWVRLPQN